MGGRAILKQINGVLGTGRMVRAGLQGGRWSRGCSRSLS